jgi:hypothetical protein
MTFPYLSDFCTAYFHQDWVEVYGDDPDLVISAYIRDATANDRLKLIEDITRFLDMDESDRPDFMHLRGSYNYKVDGYTHASWLTHVRNRLK